MSEPDSDRLDALAAETVERLLEDPQFDLEAFLRAHPGQESEMRALLTRLRAAGLLGDQGRPASVGTIDPGSSGDPAGHVGLLEALRRKPPLHERYEVRHEIDRGGMGRVLAVFDRELRRTLAMKIVRTPPSEAARGEMVARFLEEARITGQLTHQGIVPIHDLGLTEDGALYYTMRLIEGRQTLSKVFELARAGREGWTRTRALDAILRACEAVAYAHQRGVIHRDLKPGNVMVGPLGEVFVVDWGLSRVLEAAPGEQTGEVTGPSTLESERAQADSPYLTVQGQTLGTPYYMSPEQARGDRGAVDARSDVYSMGAVLYEFLTGRPPYAAESRGSSAGELVDRIVAGPPRSISKAALDEPAELVAICDKALQREPGDRYPSITELAADLRAFAEGRVVAAYETGAWAEARKWVRRNRSLAGALGVAVLAVLVGGVAFALKASEATRRAEDVFRLSVLQDAQELIDRAGSQELWPAHPDRIPAMEAWIADARDAVAALPDFERMRSKLRTLSLDRGEEELEQERAAHPDYRRLRQVEAELGAWRRAHEQRRRGEDGEAPRLHLDPGPEPSTPGDLVDQAWWRVRPDRWIYGLEAEGLALAQRAQERVAEDPSMQGPVEDVLAWGWFALGWDERARAVRQRALESASEAEQGTKEIKLARMVAAIRWARSPEGTQAVEDYLELLEWEAAEIAARIEAQLAERSARRFPEQYAEEGWWHGQLGDLIARLVLLDSLLAEDAVVPGYGWSVPRRLGFARELEVGFAAGGAYARDWAQALPAIRAAYPGLALEPQMGLVPIGPDPDSRLWEFAHLMSGAPARRGADGKLALVEESGLVLVLLPGGAFRMGAQKDEARGNFDPEAMWWEGPVHEVWLSPFLLSKYEMTREQWLRLTGEDPAEGVLAEGARLPIQSITWRESFDWLARSGLILPSEARWEYGARAGTDTPWFTGADPATIGEQRVANLADRSAVELDLQLSATEDWSDGFHWTAPVGSFLPNAFGLHDVLGNVGEFCLDGFLPRFYANCSWSDPVAPWEGSPVVFYRGGAWYDVATGARASRRDDRLKDSPNSGIGVRPARDLER